MSGCHRRSRPSYAGLVFTLLVMLGLCIWHPWLTVGVVLIAVYAAWVTWPGEIRRAVKRARASVRR